MSEQQLTASPQQIVDTSENWDAASHGYAEKVAPFLLESFAREVEVNYVTKELVLDDFDSVWDMLTVGAPPIQRIFDNVGANGKNRIHDALAGIIEKRFGSGPLSLSNAATLGSGYAA